MLEQFNHLTNKLSQALNKKNYTQAGNLALKQHRLIEAFEYSDYAPSDKDVIEEWQQALNKYLILRETVEAELKNLNTNTRDSLKRLNGYAK